MRGFRQPVLFSTSHWKSTWSRSVVSWLTYKGSQLAQGRDAAREVLKNDKALYDEIEAAVKVRLDEDRK
jgi:hypothetical protein